MSELKTEYEVEVTRQSAFDGQYAYLWVEKLWPSVTLKSRGSEMRSGYTLFPRGQLVVKFKVSEVSPHIVEVNCEEQHPCEEITVEQLADLLEQTINALAPSFKCFVEIEDGQDAVRDKESDY